ncbi:CDP-glycerol glycerophosphotransferase family protein [Faecalibaculum rodentium]|uniref:CDP-glycerol glycerophosphotransferase family protein n=1 Tax=Faecalibaculum rodentium TaxID=1702221 RepID=UPI0023F51570|nr:CDP-glycerol glycerophosphotransferase family protein [Faecalibaculum rodentium]
MKVLGRIKKALVPVFGWLYRVFCHLIPVDNRMILFLAFHGRSYNDNPRALYEAMRQDPRFSEYRFVWVLRNPGLETIPGAETVRYLSLGYFVAVARAKVWIFNCKMPMYLYKKKSQIYLQTWHGTPLKRLGHDIEPVPGQRFYRSGLTYEQMCRSYDVDSERYDAMISPNAFCTGVFPHAFGIKKEKLIETGYPRNDFLSTYTQEDVQRIRTDLKIPEGKKVILYAPTWRDDSFQTSGYTFRLQADFRKWKERLPEDTVVLFKPHYLIVNQQQDDPELQDFLISVPADTDIRDLYVVSDALVTDYSSVFFDYGILKRPVYFYMYDLEAYAGDLRGFYMDIEQELPGKIYRTEESLLQDLAAGEFDDSRYPAFTKRYNNREDGQASRRVLDWLAVRLGRHTASEQAGN